MNTTLALFFLGILLGIVGLAAAEILFDLRAADFWRQQDEDNEIR